MIWYDTYEYFTAIGLTPGGSSTVRIYTQTTQNTENGIYLTIKKLKNADGAKHCYEDEYVILVPVPLSELRRKI
jgi:hypothetical protein